MTFPMLPLPRKLYKIKIKIKNIHLHLPLLSSFVTFQLPLGKQDGQSDIWTYSFGEGDARRDQQHAEGYPGKEQKREYTAEGALVK